MEHANALKQFRIAMAQFVVFTDEEWQAFIPQLKFTTLRKKEHFVTAGSVCRHFAFIVKGSVRYYYSKEGTELTGYFSFENEFTSSYKSFLRQQPSLNNVQALEEISLILISNTAMQKMLDNPVLAYKMERFGRLIAEYIICCYEERMSSFIVQSPEERYLQMMETNRQVFQRIPQHYIANYLGITAVSLSRIRKRVLLESQLF
jgi:CRP-like cAMP-binding protein